MNVTFCSCIDNLPLTSIRKHALPDTSNHCDMSLSSAHVSSNFPSIVHRSMLVPRIGSNIFPGFFKYTEHDNNNSLEDFEKPELPLKSYIWGNYKGFFCYPVFQSIACQRTSGPGIGLCKLSEALKSCVGDRNMANW